MAEDYKEMFMYARTYRSVIRMKPGRNGRLPG
jgi:hypothetical protein